MHPSVLVYLVHIQSDWSFSTFPSVYYQVLSFFQWLFSVAPNVVALVDEPCIIQKRFTTRTFQLNRPNYEYQIEP